MRDQTAKNLKFGWLITASLIVMLLIPSLPTRAATDSSREISTDEKPAVKCIYHLLKSNNAVQSIDMYDIDGFRFAIEYTFRNKDHHIVAFDIELHHSPGDSLTASDQIPREISDQTITEAQELESGLDLYKKCQVDQAFDSMFPSPKARKDWRRMGWPPELK